MSRLNSSAALFDPFEPFNPNDSHGHSNEITLSPMSTPFRTPPRSHFQPFTSPNTTSSSPTALFSPFSSSTLLSTPSTPFNKAVGSPPRQLVPASPTPAEEKKVESRFKWEGVGNSLGLWGLENCSGKEENGKGKERAMEDMEPTRYVLVNDVNPHSTEQDLRNLLIPHPTLKGCFTSLLPYSQLVLVFFSIRDAISAKEQEVQRHGKGRSSFISRKEFIFYSPPGHNPLISTSEATLFISLRGIDHFPHSNLIERLASFDIFQYDELRNYKLLEKEKSVIVEFWDERVCERVEKELIEMNKMGYGMGGKWECSTEPDLERDFWKPLPALVPSPQPLASRPLSHQHAPLTSPPYNRPKSIPLPPTPPMNFFTPSSSPVTSPQRNHVVLTRENGVLQGINEWERESLTCRALKNDEKRDEGLQAQEDGEKPASDLQHDLPKSYGIYRQDLIPTDNVISLSAISKGKDARTTMMLRNIPVRATSDQIIRFIRETIGENTFDFFYLRVDFGTNMNVGYAFINFLSPMHIHDLFKERYGTRWNICRSDKLVLASYAKVQGREALISHFRSSVIMLKEPSYRPRLYYTRGPFAGQQEPFPLSDDPDRQARSKSNLTNHGLFPASAPVFKVAQALKGLHL